MNQQPQNGQNTPQPVQNNAKQAPFYQPQTQYQPTGFTGEDIKNQPTNVANKPTASQSISWDASEYVHHDKGFGWILGLLAVAAVLVGLAVWLQIWTFAALVIIMAIAFGIVAFRPPRTLHYVLNDKGLQIDKQQYLFSDFRAFGILNEDALYTVMLLPTKRFMPAINVFFLESDGEKIVDILGSRLPLEELHHDIVEKTMRKLRF